jgi:hypothetical protein
MFASFEEKGKIYTNVIHKLPKDVIIQTITHTIHGKFYIRPEDRLIDDINNALNFLAITDAVVHNPSGEVLYRTNFLAVQRHQIIWIIPADEIGEDEVAT